MSVKKIAPVEPYSITPEQSSSVSALEMAFGTTRLLPKPDQIPNEFFLNCPRTAAQDYLDLVNALFYNRPLPEMNLEFIGGHEQAAVVKCVRAHLVSREPKHDHKMAGVAFMLSQMIKLEPVNAA